MYMNRVLLLWIVVATSILPVTTTFAPLHPSPIHNDLRSSRFRSSGAWSLRRSNTAVPPQPQLPLLGASIDNVMNEEGISSMVIVVDAIIHSPIFWSASVMVTIVTLLLIWDKCVDFAREKTPRAIIPVIERMLIEMGSLGFIGIVISVLLNRIALGNAVGAISEEFLGERDIILETFEFLHEAFFQVAILFFVATGIMVIRVIQNLCEITSITEDYLGDDPSNCDNELVEEKLAGILKVYTLPI